MRALVEEGEAMDLVEGGAKGCKGVEGSRCRVEGVLCVVEGGHDKGPCMRRMDRFVRGEMGCVSSLKREGHGRRQWW